MLTDQAETQPVTRILTAIADEENVDPAAMNPPLADVIDPDALNKLLDQEPTADNADLEVRFSYRGHDVVAGRNGDVEVR